MAAKNDIYHQYIFLTMLIYFPFSIKNKKGFLNTFIWLFIG